MTKSEKFAWNLLHRHTVMNERARIDLEVSLHARYSALHSLGWRAVVWCDGGAYYLPNTPAMPDFNDKRHISLVEFEDLLTNVENAIRKPIHGETTSSPIATSQAV